MSCRIKADIAKPETKHPAYLGEFLNPWETGDPNELIRLEFEDAELSSFIRYIEDLYGLTFILDDAIKPVPKDGKSALGSKVTFKTNEPLSKKEAWGIFLTFLDMAGLTTVPGTASGIYRITTTNPKSEMAANKQPLPTFLGVHPSLLPDNDTLVRYVYFVRDASIDIIKGIFDSMRSATSPNLIIFPEVQGIVVTDKSYNIKAMLEIVNELDKVTMPERLSIIKLRRTDANKVAKLYEELIKDGSGGKNTLASRLLGSRKPQTMSYFDSSTRVIPEPRTNTLILLGAEESVQKIEDFILREIDKEVELPYSPMHVYTLKYVQAEAVADILNRVVKFQTDSEAAKAGGVRDGDKFFKPVTIVPEKSGNRLIITADYEDYVKLVDILKKIDVEQPQVALKVLVLNVDVTDAREFGAQIRNKKPGVDGLLSSKVNFQTSGLAGTKSIVENTTAGAGTGAQRLLGNLISLATGGVQGSTYLTLGSDCFGVWGMFRMLDSYVHTDIVSNPFLVTTNNYPAEISLGEKRRVLAARTTGAGGVPTDSFENLEANLKVEVTPQISYEGFITLDIKIQDNQFTNPTDTADGNRTEKEIKTSVILANNETLALGGIVRNSTSETESKVPVLGDIPGVGWLFKNKQKNKVKSSLLILISPEIIPVDDKQPANELTINALNDAKNTLTTTDRKYKTMDPIHRWFFNDAKDDGEGAIDEFIEKEERYLHPSQMQGRNQNRTRKRLSDFL